MKIKKADLFFFISWILYLYSYIILNQTEFAAMYDTTSVNEILKTFVMALSVYKIVVYNKYKKKEIIPIILFGFLIIVISYKSHSNFIFLTYLLILAAKDIKFNMFIKVDLIARTLLICIILFMCFTGIIINYTKNINGNYKQALGFYHPNTLAIFLITILLEWIYNGKNKNPFLKNTIIFIMLVVLMLVCKARTTIYAFTMLFTLYLIIKKRYEFKSKLIKIFLFFLPIIMIAISFITIYEYKKGNSFMIKLDDILTTRLSLGSKFYDEYGISLFGQKIDTIGTRKAGLLNVNSKILDMGYLRIGINFGIITLLIVATILIYIQKKAIDEKKMELLLCNTFFVIIGFSETYTYLIGFNFLLIILLSKTKREE